MISVSQNLLNLYRSSSLSAPFQFATKLQVLNRDYQVVDEFEDTILDGRITVDNSRVSVRSFDLTATNVDGKLTWGSTNLIWLDKYFKIYFGVKVNGSMEWISQGVFPVSAPIATSESSNTVKNEIEFSGNDKMSFLGKCEDTVTVVKGTDIATAIKSVLSGIETLFNLDDTSAQPTTPYDISWAADTDYSKIISDLAAIIVWETYYDTDGYLRLHAPIDPTTTSPLLTLSATGTSFNLWAGSQRQMDDSNLANTIVVYGGSAQTNLVNYTIQDTSASSPTSVQNIGKRVYVHNNGNPDPLITTQALAQARAEYEYKNRLQVVEKLSFKMFPTPFMDVDDVYEITDDNNGTNGKYQVVSFTLPLGLKQSSYHTGYVWQVRNFA